MNLIKRVQSALNKWFAHRNVPISVTVDGDKGPQTVSALSEFKLCLGFVGHDINGVIGPKTLRALGLKLPPFIMSPLQAIRGMRHRRFLQQKLNNPRLRVVRFAKSFIGVKENPAGSNSGGIISTWEQRLGFGPAPWCGIFAANMLLHVGVAHVTSRLASVALIEDDARSGSYCFRSWANSVLGVQPGDLVVLFGRGVHVEVVDHVDLSAGVVYTIGGNTSSGVAGSQSNGGMVANRVRSLSDVHGFALVNYPS